MYHKLQLVGCPEFIPRHEEWNADDADDYDSRGSIIDKTEGQRDNRSGMNRMNGMAEIIRAHADHA